MESFYSIIYYKTNPLSDELLAIGLLAGGGEGPWFYLSKKRMRILKEVLSKSAFFALNRSLKGFQDKVSHYRQDQSDLLLFDPYFSIEEMTRIHKYLNGALVYSEPVVVNEWMNFTLYEQLVNSVLGESIQQPTTAKTFLSQWREQVRAFDKETWKRNVIASELSFETIAPFKIDLWQTVENKLFKAIDFSKSEKINLQQIHEVVLLSQESAIKEIDFHVIYEMPKNVEKKKFVKKWQQEIKDCKWLTIQQFLKSYQKK